MPFVRPIVASGTTLPRQSRQGEGLLANVRCVEVTADTNQTITVDQMAGGAINYTGFSAGRNLTTPTAAQILAASPDMDIGDSYSFLVSIQDAFAGTWVAGAGVTLAGRATTPASSWSWIVVTRTGAATVEWRVL